MNGVYRATCLGICLLLGACGNKGELYLDQVELSDEQKALLDELETQNAKKKKAGTTETTETTE